MALRDDAVNESPPWLSDLGDPENPDEGVGGRFMFLLGLMGDANLDKLTQGIDARMPLRAGDDALALIGADRVLPRGKSETTAAYGRRLQQAFETWQHAGLAITVLRQILIALGTQCRIASVTTALSNGTARMTQFQAGADVSLPPSRNFVQWAWDSGFGIAGAGAPNSVNGFDSHPITMAQAWWRVWLVLWAIAPNNWCNPGRKWGDGWKWGDGTAWGVDVRSEVVEGIRAVIRTFKCANSWYRWIVISFDVNFARWGVGTYPNSADWTHWHKVVSRQYVQARPSNLRFCTGVSTAGA